jgi:hypothetical protein
MPATQVFEADHRNRSLAQLPSGIRPPVACNDAIGGIDENGIYKPESLDALGDLLDLFRRMGTGVTMGSPQRSEIPQLDFWMFEIQLFGN